MIGSTANKTVISGQSLPRRSDLLLCYIALLALWLSPPHLLADVLRVQTATGGVAIGGPGNGPYTANMGFGDGLGISTNAGVSLIANGSGAFFITPYNLSPIKVNKNPSNVYAWITTPFPTVQLVAYSCLTGTTCNGGTFTPISSNSATPTLISSSPIPNNAVATATLAIFVAAANGGPFLGSASVVIRFRSVDVVDGSSDVADLTVSINVRSAVRLGLATATGGLAVSPASDFAMNYGNVNGLGIGPAAGLSIVSDPAGSIYATPYQILPSFSGQTSTTGTVTVYVSTPFVNTVLTLRDAAAATGPYTNISGAVRGTTIGSFNNGATVTRYLGLLVSKANTAVSFAPDSATLTYTLTVP